MLVLFLVLLIAPLIARNMSISLPTIPMDLMQPLDANNNDTTTDYTGAGLPKGYIAASSAATTS
ncbi:hypothetical protein P175DRAFT_0504075 [Aspergillus ochraceoroseus IBT 24754]|nr:uncharacterized protein P175DRAFT_0504075 [Aspergillus ochraceoroseus IBT 24754]PTU18173.1 hypothetical protein P175DRAFT_0504075 [Aspergillus ochraceoroseus IBT 24754]